MANDEGGEVSLAVVHRHGSGLWHAALRGWRQGTDGRVETTGLEAMPDGHADPHRALRDARARWPAASDPSRSRGGPRLAETDLPSRCEVTVVSPRSRSAGEPWVEATLDRAGIDAGVDQAGVGFLVEAGALRPDSSSGRDPALAFRYDHYVRA